MNSGIIFIINKRKHTTRPLLYHEFKQMCVERKSGKFEGYKISHKKYISISDGGKAKNKCQMRRRRRRARVSDIGQLSIGIFKGSINGEMNGEEQAVGETKSSLKLITFQVIGDNLRYWYILRLELKFSCRYSNS